MKAPSSSGLRCIAPALPLEEVFDPTGAGDTFAGGFIGHIAQTRDVSFGNMKTAIIVGSAMASFCVEKFGPTRLQEITKEDIAHDVSTFTKPEEFTRYQSAMLKHASLLDDQATR